jgi:hypothetical protein
MHKPKAVGEKREREEKKMVTNLQEQNGCCCF